MSESMSLRGTLTGHNGWVTQIATTPEEPDMVLSASRGTSQHRLREGGRERTRAVSEADFSNVTLFYSLIPLSLIPFSLSLCVFIMYLS